MSPRELTIRPTKPARIYTIVFMTIWCGFVLAFSFAAIRDGSPAAVVPLSMLVLGGGFGYRLFNLAVVATPGELLVRNYVSTRRVPKEQVEGFRIGPPSTGSGKAVVALVQDDTVVSLDATARPFPWFGRGRQLEKALSDLRGWLSE